ncbi:hypothetical protein Ahy_B10g104026 [Arachis hypogaea]|uniref:CCHC-type domain-containing protein n=1 Tax=Arachis hypogaea TaxID=3818 RepID=A0A444X4K0_ARAHY|nr:hypothetical protein Ahy_B10g104026 [Arachis hypogaea]
MCVTHCDKRASVFVVEETLFKVYEADFPSILDKKLWPEWYGTRVYLNPNMRKKATGRPVSTRFCNEMDDGGRQEKKCGLCRQTGHTRRGCPNQPTYEA